jgi:hypothetical protein
MELMSREVFDQNGDAIGAAVRLLLDNPKRRRQFQLATVYEKRTNELLVEVLFTGFGPVVVYSTRIMRSGKSGFGGVRQYRKSRPIAPLTGKDDQVFYVMSRSTVGYELWGSDLIRVVAGDVDPATFRFAGDDTGALAFKRVATIG